MDGWLKQSTARTLKIGPFVDSTDGNTEETGLTISQADVRLSKNGGNMAQKNEATSCTHDELGLYDCPVDTTDTNTLGLLELAVHESGALVVRHTYMVITGQVWDSLFGADALQVHAVEIANDLITAASIAANAITSSEIANDAITNAKVADGFITAAKLATDTIANAKIADGAITAAKLAADSVTAAKVAADVTTELQNGLATSSALSTAQTAIDAIKVKTDNLPSDPADASDIATSFSGVNTKLDTIKVKTDQLTFTVATKVDSTPTITAAERNSMADAFLARNIAGGSSAGRLVSQALGALRNKWEIVAGILTVYATDDVTPLWDGAVTVTAGDPISAVDPA